MENVDLWVIRFKSFGMEILGLLITGVIGFALSPDFQTLIANHFGGTLFGSLFFLIVVGLAKHFRNLKLVSALGSEGERKMFF